MGAFKPMVKMDTTEPSVELKLKKGGTVSGHKAMKKAKKAENGFKSMKMADGGLTPISMVGAPVLSAPAPVTPTRAPARPSLALRRRAMAGKKAPSRASAAMRELASVAMPPMKKGGATKKCATGGVVNGQGGFKTGGVVKGQAGYKTGGVVKGNAGGYKDGGSTGDVKLGNGGGYKKGGKAKKAYANGGSVNDAGKAVGMPQKPASKPVRINELSGTFKKGGGVTSKSLQSEFKMMNAPAVKAAKANSNLKYKKGGKVKKMADGGNTGMPANPYAGYDLTGRAPLPPGYYGSELFYKNQANPQTAYNPNKYYNNGVGNTGIPQRGKVKKMADGGNMGMPPQGSSPAPKFTPTNIGYIPYGSPNFQNDGGNTGMGDLPESVLSNPNYNGLEEMPVVMPEGGYNQDNNSMLDNIQKFMANNGITPTYSRPQASSFQQEDDLAYLLGTAGTGTPSPDLQEWINKYGPIDNSSTVDVMYSGATNPSMVERGPATTTKGSLASNPAIANFLKNNPNLDALKNNLPSMLQNLGGMINRSPSPNLKAQYDAAMAPNKAAPKASDNRPAPVNTRPVAPARPQPQGNSAYETNQRGALTDAADAWYRQQRAALQAQRDSAGTGRNAGGARALIDYGNNVNALNAQMKQKQADIFAKYPIKRPGMKKGGKVKGYAGGGSDSAYDDAMTRANTRGVNATYANETADNEADAKAIRDALLFLPKEMRSLYNKAKGTLKGQGAVTDTERTISRTVTPAKKRGGRC